MKKISISNSITGRSWGAQFEQQADLDAWLASHVAKNTFGLPERPELVLNEQGEEVPSGATLPAEYAIVVEDITAQVEQAVINAEAQAYLESTDWMVLRNVRELALGIPTSLNSSEYLALEQERADAAARIIK
jgi:hypothetical protein